MMTREPVAVVPVEAETPETVPVATRFVGTLVGESTSTEFRLAVAHEMIREQDIIAVDAELRRPENEDVEKIRVWAKVKRIERLNPLFPTESGHELAATKTNPFETILSLSREMVTAVCQVLGSEPLNGDKAGKLNQLRYPPQPATTAYRPDTDDVTRVVIGGLQSEDKQIRALDVAHLANRKEVEVKVDGHAIVTRHLAILAMTGSGKTWASRRILEELAKRNHPIVIFDPHGDYTGLADVKGLGQKVKQFYASFPVFEQDGDTVASVVNVLGGSELSPAQRPFFDRLFDFAKQFLVGDDREVDARKQWLVDFLNSQYVTMNSLKPNAHLLGHLAEAAQLAVERQDSQRLGELAQWGWTEVGNYDKNNARTLKSIAWKCRKTAKALRVMEDMNRQLAKGGEPLPNDRTELVKYGQVSVVSLAGYTGEFQATIYSLIADAIFSARVAGTLPWRVLLVLEEAHNFVPGRANTPAEERSIAVTKQIAQEGRKFGVGLVMISQRPSRLDETTLSQCNSFLVMRMVNPADQNFVRKVIETLGEDDARLLPDLDKGEALLSGQFINFPVLVKMKEPLSRGEREEKDAFAELEESKRTNEAQTKKPGGR